MKEIGLSKFETDVMEMLLAGEHEVLKTLRYQFVNSTLLSRKHTGVGFYLYFSSKLENGALNQKHETKDRFQIGDLGGMIGIPPIEAGFVLWVIDGMINCLEGYSYGDDKWPENIENYYLYYLGKRDRDIANLVDTWTK